MEELLYLSRFSVVFIPLAAVALLVKYERKLSRWLGKKPRRRRRPVVPKAVLVR